MIGIISHYKIAEEGGNTNRGIEKIARTVSPMFALGALVVLYLYIFKGTVPL